jgi:hypothetical protein
VVRKRRLTGAAVVERRGAYVHIAIHAEVINLSPLRELSSKHRLMAGGVLLVLLGVLIGTLGSSLALTTSGLLLASAGAAALISSFGFQKLSESADRRFLLALLLCLVILPAAFFLSSKRPGVDIEFSHIEPNPGAPIALTGLFGEESRPKKTLAPISAAFGRFSFSPLAPPAQLTKPPATERLLLKLPVPARECRSLETEMGGSCSGKLRSADRQSEPIVIETMRSTRPLTADIWPRSSETLEMSESTSLAQQRVPTEWSLEFDGGLPEIRFGCRPGTPLLIKQLPIKTHTRCGAPTAYYKLEVKRPPGLVASISLNELSEFSAQLKAHLFEGAVETGNLTVAGGHRDLPGGPVAVAARGASGHGVELEILQAGKAEQNSISLSSGQAEHVSLNGHEQVPTWQQQNSAIVYFLLGVLAAVLVPALFDFAVYRLTK